MTDPRLTNGNFRLDALIDETSRNNEADLAASQGIYRDAQVKGRVVTQMAPVMRGQPYGIMRPGFEVKQVIDGVVTAYKTFSNKLEAADEYAMLRAHARRRLHVYLADIAPEANPNLQPE